MNGSSYSQRSVHLSSIALVTYLLDLALTHRLPVRRRRLLPQCPGIDERMEGAISGCCRQNEHYSDILDVRDS